jgi:hypothetical protein
MRSAWDFSIAPRGTSSDSRREVTTTLNPAHLLTDATQPMLIVRLLIVISLVAQARPAQPEVAGQVVDASGAPLPGVRVQSSPLEDVRTDHALPAAARYFDRIMDSLCFEVNR